MVLMMGTAWSANNESWKGEDVFSFLPSFLHSCPCAGEGRGGVQWGELGKK
jgi:hypothetical protein